MGTPLEKLLLNMEKREEILNSRRIPLSMGGKENFWMVKNKRMLLAVAGIAVLLILSGIFAFAQESGFEVAVGGKSVGFVKSRDSVKKITAEMIAAKEKETGLKVRIATDITYNEVSLQGREVSSEQALQDALAENLTFEAEGYAVVVDGEKAVTCRTEEEAKQAVEKVKADLAAELENKGDTKVTEVTIEEDITYESNWVPVDQLKTADEGAKALLLGTDEIVTYEVKSGDSLWSIANKNAMSVEELRKANPQLKSDILQPGMELSLVVAKPFVTILTKEISVVEKAIPYDVKVIKDSTLLVGSVRTKEAGKKGLKEVTYEIIRENGVEKEKTIIKEVVTQKPKTQVVVKGTKPAPNRGTGRFVWPMQGRISSQFGYRWGRMHEGVDIAAPTGTAVIAADSGTVVFAGYKSGYGLMVEVNHGNGFSTRYAHNSKLLVSGGQKVNKGQLIARSGNTGRSTGPHLHFEIRKNGVPQNPLNYFR